jgi:hypothetical protein
MAGCGGESTEADSGGLTASDRKAAESALHELASTAIPSTLIKVTAIAAAAPDVCRIRLQSTNPRKFRLFVFWTPQKNEDPEAGANEPTYAWLDATLGETIVASSFHMGHASTKLPRAAVLRSHAGNVFSKPGDGCELLATGNIRLSTV